MRGVVYVQQLRAQFVAIVGVNIKTGCPECLGPVVHGPSTKQTAILGDRQLIFNYIVHNSSILSTFVLVTHHS